MASCRAPTSTSISPRTPGHSAHLASFATLRNTRLVLVIVSQNRYLSCIKQGFCTSVRGSALLPGGASTLYHEMEAGQYICTATDPRDKRPLDSDPVILKIRQPEAPPTAPQVDPQEQTVNEGDPAQFRCWVPGNPQAVIRWSKRTGEREDHFPFRCDFCRIHRNTSRCSALPAGTLDRDGFLRITSAKMSDAGEYICTATDPRGGPPVEAPPARLNVNPLPFQPQVEPPERNVNEGDPAQFRCWVPGYPHAVIRWNRERGQPLPVGASARDGYLRFDRTRMSDDGYYICTASDPTDPRRGPPREAPPARLRVTPPFAPQVDPPEQTVNEGEPAQFRCTVPGNPHAILRWSKQSGLPFPHGTMERDGFLRINSARMSDAGAYICTATDPRGGPPRQAPPARLHVKKPAMAPQVDPPSQTVDEGQPSSIRCWVPGNPRAQLRWTKHGRQPLPPHAHERDGVLTIPQTSKSDEGHYVCTAFDPETRTPTDAPPCPHRRPTTRAQGDINEDSVQDRGILTVNNAKLSDDGEYICSAEDPRTGEESEAPPASVHVTPRPRRPDYSLLGRGDPQARLTFKRADGAPIPFGATDLDGVLAISSTLKSDEGDYICTYHPADGSRPKDSTPSTLKVETPGEPPRPVATPPVLTVKRGQPAQFHCDAHSPTPAQIKWGHDEQPPTARVEPRVWNGKPGDKHQFKCHVTGVPTPKVTWSGPNNSPLPHDVTELEGNILDFANGRTELNGDYTCTATNPVGEASDYGSVNIGPSLTVKTTPAGPRLILTVGEPLLVKCEAFGEPEPEVEWLYDPGPERGDLPDDYKPVTISEQFIRHPAIGLGNAGAYTCKGSNSHATATKNIYVEGGVISF
ncbi:immunoglobulin domain protein [Ostertagia ostertagi]